MIFSATENSKKKRILVADDSITIQKLVNVTFAGDDFEVITALDGFDAGTKVRRLKPEIVLIDTHLREVSGAQLLTEIRKDTTLLHTKVIMLKANLSDDEQQALIGLPYDLLLEKPFDSRKLSEAVRHLLQSENSTVIKKEVVDPADKKKEAIPQDAQHDSEQAISGPFSSYRENHEQNSRLSSRLSEIAAEVVQKPEPTQAKVEVPAHPTEPHRPDESFRRTAEEVQEAPSSKGLSKEELEAIAREEIRAWIYTELPKIGEKHLKEAISKISEEM